MIRSYPKSIFSGTSGLVLPEANKLAFPPAFQDKSRLSYYASLFNSIEFNSSFKKVPMPRTVEKWAGNVPDDFQFTFKCPGTITHNKELRFNRDDIFDFIRVIDHVGNKKGCLLMQFPGKLNITYAGEFENVLNAVRMADPGKKWRVAWEFRNSSWYHPDIYDLLHRNDMTLVLHDMPASATPLTYVAPVFIYLRFHGPEKGYRGNYTDDFLFKYAQQIKAWKKEKKDVYLYFNNTLGNAVNNLITLNRLITMP